VLENPLLLSTVTGYAVTDQSCAALEIAENANAKTPQPQISKMSAMVLLNNAVIAMPAKYKVDNTKVFALYTTNNKKPVTLFATSSSRYC
jgi:hypothetical protein